MDRQFSYNSSVANRKHRHGQDMIDSAIRLRLEDPLRSNADIAKLLGINRGYCDQWLKGKSISSHSKGGQVMAIRQKKKAEDKYLASPKICKQCDLPIQLLGRRPCEVSSLTFCTQRCAGLYNSRIRKVNTTVKVPGVCAVCESSYYGAGEYCRKCIRAATSILPGMTLEKLFSTRKNYQSARSTIRRHADAVFMKKCNNTPVCEVCGYFKQVDAAHIKSVSSFPKTATVAEVNSPDNLIGLCPNHHWEFDHGVLGT